jgi:hypothetical protein
MKSIIKIALFSLFISCTFHVYAQDELANSSFDVTSILAKEVFDNLNKVYLDKSQNTNQFLQNNNLIQIKQIGYYNYSDINVRGINVSMDVSQNGNNNYVNVYKNAFELNQNISQNGNNNFISDFSMYSRDPINTTFNQEGNNLTIISTGSNSISKNLEINQTGNSGTVYIYNR